MLQKEKALKSTEIINLFHSCVTNLPSCHRWLFLSLIWINTHNCFYLGIQNGISDNYRCYYFRKIYFLPFHFFTAGLLFIIGSSKAEVPANCSTGCWVGIFAFTSFCTNDSILIWRQVEENVSGKSPLTLVCSPTGPINANLESREWTLRSATAAGVGDAKR